MPAPVPFLCTVAALSVAALGASTARAGDEPGEVAGARYSFTATAAGLSSSGRGEVNLSGTLVAVVRGSRRVASGKSVVFKAQVVGWQLDFLLPRKTLRLKVKVTKGPAGCPPGARGTVTVVDDDIPLANGSSSDTVRIRFARTACAAFAEAWSNAGGGEQARVRIELETG